MVSGSQVSSCYEELNSHLKNYNSLIDSLNSSWKGPSYESVKSQAVAFLEEFSSVIANQMTSFTEAVNLYQEYINDKKNLTVARNNYNQAVANKNNSDASRFNIDVGNLSNRIQQLSQQINACLSSINQKLEAKVVQVVTTTMGAAGATGSTISTLNADGSIGYKLFRYESEDNPGVSVWVAVIPKDQMPKLGIANDDYTKVSKEAPTSMAKRKNAALAINFGIENTKQGGILYADGKLVRGNNITSGDTLYLTQDGLLKSVPNSQYSTEDILALNPVWASKGFYTIVQDGQFVSTWDPAKNSKEVVSRREPRTFIGQDYDGNYIVGVCHGRRKGEAGMNMKEIYDFVSKNVSSNIRILYNADGGGSSAFVYHGEKINPNIDTLDSGATVERLRPDIIYWS